MPYTPVNFQDGVTPLNAATMNKLDDALEDLYTNPAAALTYEGDHVPATSYQDGDIVVKDGIAYLCVGGPTTAAPNPVPWGPAGMMSGYIKTTDRGVANGVASLDANAKVPLAQLPTTKAARIFRNSGQSIPTGVPTFIQFTGAQWDTDTMWSAGAPDRLTIKTAGTYLLLGLGSFDAGGSGYRLFDLCVNGALVIAQDTDPVAAGASPAQIRFVLSAIWVLGVNDFVGIRAEHNNGAAINAPTYSNIPWLSAALLT